MTSHAFDQPTLDAWTSTALTAVGDLPPTVDQLVRLLSRLTTLHPGTWEMEQVGRSRNGEPLHLTTIHGGPIHALIIAGPHPNEPIGAGTVAALAHLLHQRPDAVPQVTWHLMPCLDPDGARLNTWTGSTPSLGSYHRGFYRPANADQPEWMLPRTGGSTPLPESAALAQVIDTVRPNLLASLHGSESGGAFLLAAQDDPLLVPVLARAASHHDIPIEDHPSDALAYASPGHGTFVIPAPEPPGTSSIHYADSLGAHYALVSEVPMWGSRPHALPADQAASRLEEAATTLTRLVKAASLPADANFSAALADSVRGMRVTAQSYRAHPESGSGQDLAYLLPLRAGGMLLRTLASLPASRTGPLDAVRALTEATFSKWLGAAEDVLQPELLPLRRTAGLQLDVILGTLALLVRQGAQRVPAADTNTARHRAEQRAPAARAAPGHHQKEITETSGADGHRPGHRIGCFVLIRNPGGEVLLVNPADEDGHRLVGGGAQPGEEPQQAAYRQVVAETGLSHLTIGDLLLVDYVPADPRTGTGTGEGEGYDLIFTGGVIADDAAIVLPAGLPGHEPHLTRWVFCAPDHLPTYCVPDQARRIAQALDALTHPAQRGLRIQGTPAR
ncbi:NUDIX domain-containing protein [Streptomyces sp. NPDC004111]|uniref:NUDIX domain-containing protein n=1 Tax=Streptomyces sp. NPDC004111 TaxID=3364690 RepID=UPI00369A2704